MPNEPLHEYAFVTTLSAVARVKAINEEEARSLLNDIDCIDLSSIKIADNLTITEASLCEETSSAELIEIDGQEVAL